MKKLSRGKKAWATRKKNAKKKYDDSFKNDGYKAGGTLHVRLPNGYIIQDDPGETKPYTPAPLALCGQLEDAILLLENRISNAIAKINSLM